MSLSVLSAVLAMVSGEVLTLEAARLQALAHNVDLQAAAAQARGADAEVGATEAARAPGLGFTLQVGASPGAQLVELPDTNLLVSGAPSLSEGLAAFEPVFTYRATFDAAWVLTDFGRTASAVAAARARREVARARVSGLEQEIERRVDIAYVAWLQSYRRAELDEAALSHARQRLAKGEGDVEDGASRRGSILPVQLSLLRAELDARASLDAERQARDGLAGVVGVSLSDVEPDPKLLTRPVSRARGRSGIVDAEARLASAELERARRAQRPELVLTGQLGVRGQALSLFPVYAGGLRLSVPLLDGGRSASLRKAASEELAARRAQQREAQRIWSNVEAQRARAERTAHAQLATARQMVEVARAWQADAEARRPLGDGESELRRADDAVRESERIELNMQLGLLRARLKLD